MKRLVALALLGLTLSACQTAYRKSIGGGEPTEYVTRIYLTDFNVGWQSILDALKHSPLDVSNREGGFVQTKWTDNTAERNFVEAFGNQDVALKAQYRFRVSIAKGFYNGQPSVKIQVSKEQLVERDILEGWHPIGDEDKVDENTLLYRIGRLIYMKMKLALLEEQKGGGGAPTPESPPPPDTAAPPPDTSPPPETTPDNPPPGKTDTQELDILEKQ
jgi:hypothetical protein